MEQESDHKPNPDSPKKPSRGGEFDSDDNVTVQSEAVVRKNISTGNFCFIFGTSPAHEISIDTKMIKNLLDHMLLKQDKQERFVQFPSILNQIEADDAKFELSVGNSV